MAKNAERSNRNTGLIFFNEAGTLSGYYRDEREEEFLISGSVNQDVVSFTITDRSHAVQRGEGTYRKHTKTSSNPRAPIASGNVTFDGVQYPICVITAQSKGTRLHSFFPDAMPATVDAPF